MSNQYKNFEIDKLLYEGWKDNLPLMSMVIKLYRMGYRVRPQEVLDYWVQLDDYTSKPLSDNKQQIKTTEQ